MILAGITDDLALRNLAGAIAGMQEELVRNASDSSWDDVTTEPTAVIVDLEAEAWERLVGEAKSRWPQTMVVGILNLPDRHAWERAEDAGCDLVTTRGSLKKRFPASLESWRIAPGGRRIPLFAMTDIAGRLGLVKRLDDEATGPVAIYHIGKEVVAVSDLCPHAGAMLSKGEVSIDDGIVTCPEHGSRFDTRTGERIRGPADVGVKTFAVVVKDGQAYLQVPSR